MSYGTITVKMCAATPGTWGHMWVVLDGPGIQGASYGFQPKDASFEVLVGAPGYIATDDDATHTVTKAVQFQVDESQFAAALDFCKTCEAQEAYGEYTLPSHVCVDFAWDVVKQAGIPVFQDIFGVLIDSDGRITTASNANMMDYVALAYSNSGGAYTLAPRSDTDLVPLIDEYVRGGAAADRLNGGIGDDKLWGFGGDDVLLGGPGYNTLYGGKGDDTLYGGPNNDTYIFQAGDGNDTINTGGGNDKLVTSGGYTAFKREGIDLLVQVGPTDGSAETVRVKDWFTAGTTSNMLAAIEANGLTYSRFAINDIALHVDGSDDTDSPDNIAGTYGYSDIIHGNGGDDFIDVSQSGDIKASDEVHGGDGNDEIYGGNSNDFLYGDEGDDVVDGGTGNDHLEGGAGNDSLYSWGGTSTLDGGDGDDLVFSQGTGATLEGGDGADYVYAKGSQNTLQGGAGQDIMRTAGNSLLADGGADEDWLWDLGSNNVLYGGVGDDSFTLQGTNAMAFGGSGVDYFENYGFGNTLDGGADNDFYYSENTSFTVVMSETSGHDTLAMDMPTAGVLRVSGVLSGALTTYVDGTSLVLSTGTSSLTILDYIVDGAVNPNFQGIELDDKTVPTSELPHPDTSTIRGTAGIDSLQGNGIANRIIGMGSDDYLFGSAGAAETFEWSQGDGLDTVLAQGAETLSFEGDGYGVSAHRSGNDLTLTASTGGGFVIPNWFGGQNQVSVKAPDGTVWSAADINAEFGSQTYVPSTVAIGETTTSSWTGGAPVVFGSDFAGRDMEATLSYHYGTSPSHYDLRLSDGQGTSFTFENWSQGNVSSVTLPDGATFTPSQLNAMLHPPTYSVTYDHVYSQSDWQSVVSSLGPAYAFNGSDPWVGAFMGGQQTGMYQGAPEPAYAVRRYTVTMPSGGYAGGGVTSPEPGDAAVQTRHNVNASWSVTFDFWGTQGNYAFAIVDARSSYSNVVESRVQSRDEEGNLLFDFGGSVPNFLSSPWQLVSSVSDSSGYHDTPNVTTTRAAHLAETLYEAGTVEPAVDSFVLFDAGTVGARGMASAWEGTSVVGLPAGVRVSTGYLTNWDSVPLVAGPQAASGLVELGTSLSPTTIDAWRRGMARIGEDLELPTKTAEVSPALVSTGYLAQRDFGEVPVTTGLDPLFGRPTEPVPYLGGTNEFRLAA